MDMSKISRILPTSQEQLFTEDRLATASNKKQMKKLKRREIFVSENIFQIINVYDNVKWTISLIFILIEPLTLKKENISCLFHSFLHWFQNPL